MFDILTLWENLGMVFELQPTLKGSLVELRPLREDDFEAVYAAASDPLVWEQHPESNRYQRDVFSKFFEGAMESGGAFAVSELRSGEIIGSSRYYDYSAERRDIQIGYTFLARAYWGRSYNPEAKRLMLDHAFRFVDRVFFEVGENNLRSQKALERIGARFVSKVEFSGLDGNILRGVRFEISR